MPYLDPNEPPDDDEAATPSPRPWSRSPLEAVALVVLMGALAPVLAVGLLALASWATSTP